MFILKINGSDHHVDAAPDMPMLRVLRDILKMTGTKFGCGKGLCGALNSLYHLRRLEYEGDTVGHYKYTELVYRWSPYYLREQGVFIGYEEELVDSIYSLSKLVPSTSSSISADKELLMEYAKKESDYQINYSERPVICFPGLKGNFAEGMLETIKEGKRKHRYKPDIFLFSDKYPYR